MRKYLLFIIALSSITFNSCINCEKSAQSYRTYDLEVILTERPFIRGDMKFIGTKLNTDEITTTRIVGRWFRDYIDYMEVGDTVIKRKEELTLYVHKKDTVMVFKWDCQGKVYE